MYAISLLGTVNSVERRGGQLLEMRTFDPTETDTLLSETATSLIDLAELLRVSTPFPLDRHDRRAEAAVGRILEEQYSLLSVLPEEFDDETLEIAERSAGVEFGDSWVLVPLDGSDSHGRNWGSVLRVIRSRVAEILSDFKRVLHRLRASDSEQELRATCDCVLEMLESLEYALDRIVATAGYVTHRTDHDQTELLDALERKAAVFSGDTDA